MGNKENSKLFSETWPQCSNKRETVDFQPYKNSETEQVSILHKRGVYKLNCKEYNTVYDCLKTDWKTM